MNSISIKLCKKRRSIFSIISAVVLHIFSMYMVLYLQNLAYAQCSPLVYMIIKFILRCFYLLVPFCFMRMEQVKLDEIGITTNKLFKQVITGVVIGSSVAVIIVGLTVLLGFREQLGNPLYEEGWQYIFYFFYTIFAVGLFEEIFFRGYIYKKILDVRDNKWFAIIVSSMIFGVCHFVGNGNFFQDVPQVLLATIMGVVYCILRERVRNCTLISLIFMHGMYDFGVAFLVFAW